MLEAIDVLKGVSTGARTSNSPSSLYELRSWGSRKGGRDIRLQFNYPLIPQCHKYTLDRDRSL